MRERSWWIGGVSLVLIVLASVLAGAGLAQTEREGADPSSDKLAQVHARGTLIMATDPAYPPQSFLVKSAKRLTTTKCAANQFTGNQISGYDADVSKLVARRLGVEACFVAPTWLQMIGGHWADRWDIAFASIGINRDRMQNLFYTQPYSAEAERFFVRKSSSYKRVGELSGKRLGGCGGCFAEFFIKGTLDAPGQKLTFPAKHATFVSYDVERNGLAAVAKGKLDGFLCGVAVGAKAIKEGLPLRPLGGDQYLGVLSGAVDRSSEYSQAAFTTRVNAIVRQLQAEGTLRRLSLHYFNTDFATGARPFDLAALGQHIP